MATILPPSQPQPRIRRRGTLEADISETVTMTMVTRAAAALLCFAVGTLLFFDTDGGFSAFPTSSDVSREVLAASSVGDDGGGEGGYGVEIERSWTPNSVRPPRILALGGSVTVGATCMTHSNRYSYPALLGDLLAAGPSSSSSYSGPSEVGGEDSEMRSGTSFGLTEAKGEKKAVVHNRAIRGSGAHYPSMCVATMVSDALREEKLHRGSEEIRASLREAAETGRNGLPLPREKKEEEEENYDVILLEFSINGSRGLEVLARRLRRRYPRAEIVYVHLVSLAKPATANVPYEVTRIMREVGGRVWRFDALPEAGYPSHGTNPNGSGGENEAARELFCNDLHHLSREGHAYVAGGIASMLLSDSTPAALLPFSTAPRLMGESPSGPAPSPAASYDPLDGTWGLGDQCYLFYHVGTVPSGLHLTGGVMALWDKGKSKWAYEFGTRRTDFSKEITLEFEVKGGSGSGEDEETTDIPIHLMHMTQGRPGFYPVVDVVTFTSFPEVGVSEENGGGAADAEFMSHIDPSIPKDPQFVGAHITEMAQVGMAKPGRRVKITVRTAAGEQENVKEEERSIYPFRTVGVTMCGACSEMGYRDMAGSSSGFKEAHFFVA